MFDSTMNRHQRRAEAAKLRAARVRHAAISDALAYIAQANDPTISGVTVCLPDGEAVYLDAQTAGSMRQGRHTVQ